MPCVVPEPFFLDDHIIGEYLDPRIRDVVVSMNKESIQKAARELQRDLWRNRDDLWPGQQVTAFEVLDPGAAAHFLGLQFEEHEDLGGERFGFRGQRFRVAGLMDRQAKKIAIATWFPFETRRFTAAHEIGHWLLHPDQVMHRDRPIDGGADLGRGRPQFEIEADYFAACFLMPPKLLEDAFRNLFGMREQFVIDENVAFHLCPSDPDSLVRVERDSLDRELVLARCGSFNGKYFRSLSEQFGVSRTAMAIRLKELEFVRWP